MTPFQYNHFVRNMVLLGLALCAACAPVEASPAPPSIQLHAYETETPQSMLATAPDLIQASEIPVPTPTPITYTVKAGDTLGQIAEKFNVELDVLLGANPGVNPNAMSVGMTLQVPSKPRNRSKESTPSPVPFPVGEVACHPTADRGLWCFVLARNDTQDLMENVTAQVTLIDMSGKPMGSQTALLPLDILPPGQSLPMSVFFPPEVPTLVRPEVQVLTSIRLLPDDDRYLPAVIKKAAVEVDSTGLSALLRGEVALREDSKRAGQIWVAAVAYDLSGQVIGIRRWEWNGNLAAGESVPFEFSVSSLAGTIRDVQFAVEARP